MTNEAMPTRQGDVLILASDRTPFYAVYAVGVVVEDGQQRFSSVRAYRHTTSRQRADAMARKSSIGPGRSVFFKRLDDDAT